MEPPVLSEKKNSCYCRRQTHPTGLPIVAISGRFFLDICAVLSVWFFYRVHHGLLFFGLFFLLEYSLNVWVSVFPGHVDIPQLVAGLEVGVAEDHVVAGEDGFDVSHGLGVAVVIDGHEPSLVKVTVPLLVGKPGLEAVGQITNPVVPNAPDNPTPLHNLV